MFNFELHEVHCLNQVLNMQEIQYNLILPHLFLESAATKKAPDKGLDVSCCFLLVLLSFSFLSSLPGFVQEIGLGALRYSKHCAPWEKDFKIYYNIVTSSSICLC